MLRKLLALLVIVGVAAGATLYEEEERVAAEIFEHGKNHLKHVAPPEDHDHHHTNVTVNMYVRNIFQIGEKSHIWKVQLTFRQEWNDRRLAFEPKNADMTRLAYGNPDDIWTPDLFFREEVTSQDHSKFHSHDLLYIYPSGHVLYSTRVTLELFCPVDFHQKNFTCPMSLASYMHPKDELDIHWKTDTPVQMKEHLFIPGYHLDNVSTEECESATVIGKFSCIRANFNFRHGTCED